MSYPAALSLRIGRYVPSISFFIFSRLSSTIGVSRCTLFEAEALSGSSSLICECIKSVTHNLTLLLYFASFRSTACLLH